MTKFNKQHDAVRRIACEVDHGELGDGVHGEVNPARTRRTWVVVVNGGKPKRRWSGWLHLVLGGVLTASGTPEIHQHMDVSHVAPPPAIDEFGTVKIPVLRYALLFPRHTREKSGWRDRSSLPVWEERSGLNMSNPKTPSTNPRRRRGVRQTAHKLLVGTVSGSTPRPRSSCWRSTT